MERDERIYFSFFVSGVSASFGCGKAYPVDRAELDFIDKLIGKTPDKFAYSMEANPVCVVQFVDVSGKPFKPSVERLFAHEMGHSYVYLQLGPDNARNITQKDYDRAVDYENIIAKEINPNAPERAVSDHGNHRNIFTKFS